MSKPSSQRKVDHITLAVVRGALETTQREMSITLDKTARSSVFNVAHDYSNALFNAKGEMIIQGQVDEERLQEALNIAHEIYELETAGVALDEYRSAS